MMPTTDVDLEQLRMQRAATASLTAQMLTTDDSRRRLTHIARVMKLNGDTEHAEFAELLVEMGDHYTDQTRQIEEALS